MVQMNVREKQLRDLCQPDALRLQPELESIETRRRTRVDEGDGPAAPNDTGGDGMGPADEVEIDPRKA
jgi:hypothetical protein